MRYSTDVVTAQVQALIDACGASGAILRVYTGAPPATLGGAYGTELVSMTFSGVIGTAASGVLTWNAASGTAGAAGTAASYTVELAAGNVIKTDGTVGTSGADLNLDTVTIGSGDTVNLTGGTYTAGNQPS